MKYKYKNNTQNTIIYHNNTWQPGDEIETSYPVPLSLGLTCTQEGDMPDPVLFMRFENSLLCRGFSKRIKK